MNIKLCSSIKELRRRDGRTQDDLACALGVTAQAVSRWETGICYPDMELIPSIANYFGVSIDELFGYENERAKKVDALAQHIRKKDLENNGVDVCVDECIRLAREGLVEFPENETLLLCLASVLYNAGYVRYGEYHQTDKDGYDVYDTERHKQYAEWQEAIQLYEKLLTMLKAGEERHQAVCQLTQLYVNTGAYEKAMALAETAPDLHGCRELLRTNACDGIQRAEVLGQTLLALVQTCSELMISGVMVNKPNIRTADALESIRNAIGIFDLVCTDKEYGLYNGYLSHVYLYLSEYLWLSGDRDGAFDALYAALAHAKACEDHLRKTGETFSSALIRQVPINPEGPMDVNISKTLPEDWPWWHVPSCTKVKEEIQADPRWEKWVAQAQESYSA